MNLELMPFKRKHPMNVTLAGIEELDLFPDERSRETAIKSTADRCAECGRAVDDNVREILLGDAPAATDDDSQPRN